MKQTDNLPGVDQRSFRCCLCCHVRTGTLIYGVFVAIAHLLFVGLLIFTVIHPDILQPSYLQRYDGVIAEPEKGTLFSGFPDERASNLLSRENLCVISGILLVTFASTLALIYGVVRNAASYMMPFFCLQVFDFSMNCLTVLSCFMYAQNVRYLVHDQELHAAGIHQPLSDLDYLTLLFIAILVLSIKAYLIGMVWSCYKYVQLVAASRSLVREYMVDPDTQILLPPSYEDAIKISTTPSNNFPGPPAYSHE